MKNSSDEAAAVLPLLVHTKNVSFEWGKSNIECFIRQAKQLGMDVHIMYNWREVFDWKGQNVLIVNGVDKEWLEEVTENLAVLQMRIILIDGIINDECRSVSQVLFDQKEVIRSSLSLLRSKGRCCPALFGIQKNDTSDTSKAEAFAEQERSDAVYWFEKDIAGCFDAFYRDFEKYDSVICSNDIVAVYFLSRCRENHILVPKQLYVIGNCDLWISSHVEPMLTTASYNKDAMIAVAIQLYRMLSAFPNIMSSNVSLLADISERASTGVVNKKVNNENVSRSLYQYDERFMENVSHILCPEILRIKKLDQTLSMCSQQDLLILQRLADGSSYEDISAETFLTVDTVKYHIKKLYRLLEIHRRHELTALLDKYSLKLV